MFLFFLNHSPEPKWIKWNTKWLKTLEQKENDVMFMKELSESLFLVLKNSSV